MNQADLPTTDVWSEYDWTAVLAGYPQSEPGIDATAREILTGTPKGEITADRIVSVAGLWAESPEGYGSTDVILLAELTDGWATLTAWCDTTGWDCQSGGEWKWAATRDEAIRNGLDKEGRGRLGLSLAGEETGA